MRSSHLNTRKNKLPGKLYGPLTEQGNQRIATNHELRELRKTHDLIADIKRTELELVGRVIRMSETSAAERIFGSWEIQGK
jgi:hypothetical protein